MHQNTVSWFQDIKDNRHVFIYSVCGRSRSTFLQRLINSSKSVSILGEHHYLIDDLCDAIWTMLLINKALGIESEEISLPSYSWMKHVQDSHTNFSLAIAEGAHDKWYPNAMGEMTNSIELVSLAIGELLHPFLEQYERFGFKEIRLKNINVLKILNWLFPNAIFIFVFREPDEQWNSISQFSQSFDYSQSLAKFSAEYKHLATSYMEFYKENSHSCLFVGEDTLLNSEAVESMLHSLDIYNFEKNLLTKKIGSSSFLKSQYHFVHLYRELKANFRQSIASWYFKKQGLFEIHNQLKQLEHSRK